MVPVLRGAEGHAAFAQRRVLNTILCVPAAENIVRTAAHTRKSSCGSGKPHPNFGPSKGLRRRVWPAVTGAWVQETADNGEERTEQGGRHRDGDVGIKMRVWTEMWTEVGREHGQAYGCGRGCGDRQVYRKHCAGLGESRVASLKKSAK